MSISTLFKAEGALHAVLEVAARVTPKKRDVRMPQRHLPHLLRRGLSGEGACHLDIGVLQHRQTILSAEVEHGIEPRIIPLYRHPELNALGTLVARDPLPQFRAGRYRRAPD